MFRFVVVQSKEKFYKCPKFWIGYTISLSVVILFLQVQEFYDKRVAEGIFPDPNKPKTCPLTLQDSAIAGVSHSNDDKDAEQKEKLLEEDDEKYIERMRAQDEFKDDHRRGWGNRMNRS